MVIVTAQVQQAVNDVTQNLFLPGRAKPICLFHRHRNAHKEISPEHSLGSIVAVAEGDNIRRAVVLQPLFIQLGDPGFPHQRDPQFEVLHIKEVLKQATDHAPQMARVNFSKPLMITQDESAPHEFSLERVAG